MSLDWTPSLYQDAIKFYLDEKKSADDTVKRLSQIYDIRMTTRQLKHKLRGMKNLRADEWILIGREISKREAQGQAWAVYLQGRLQDPHRVRKEIRRYKNRTRELDSSSIDWGVDTIGKHRIEIRTSASNTIVLPYRENSRPPEPRTQRTNQTTEPSVDVPSLISPPGAEIESLAQSRGLDTPIQPSRLPDTFEALPSPRCNLYNTSFLMSPSVILGEVDIGSNPSNLLWEQDQWLTSHEIPNLVSIASPLNFDFLWPKRPSYPLFWDCEGITSNLPHVCPRAPVFQNSELRNSHSIEIHRQPSKGEDGWLTSQLIAAGQKLEVLHQVAGQVEQILRASEQGRRSQLDSERIDEKSLQLAFAILTYLAANDLINHYDVERFLISGADNRFISHFAKYLRKRNNTIPLQSKVLQALRLNGSRNPPVHDNGDSLWGWFSCELLSVIDKRLLSGPLGRDILNQIRERIPIDASRLLIEAGAQLDLDTYDSLLNTAASDTDLDMLRFIAGASHRVSLQAGESISNVGRGALERAVRDCRIDKVAILIEAGITVKVEYEIRGESMLEYAKRKSLEMYELLQSHLVHDEESTTWLLVKAAERGNRGLAEYMINKEDMAKGVALEKALWHAVKWRRESAVRTLLRCGVDANAENYCTSQGRGCIHPLELAMPDSFGNGMVFLLVKGGARLRHWPKDDSDWGRDNFMALAQARHDMSDIGVSLLGLYFREYSFDVKLYDLSILVDAGCPLNQYDPASRRAAIQTRDVHGYLPQLQFLIDSGADVNLPAHDSGGRTALQAAAEDGSLEAIDFLLDEAGADIQAAPAKKNGLTVLEAAAKHMADIRSQMYSGDDLERLLRIFVASFKKLIAHGAPLNRADGGSGSLLHWLVLAPSNECLKLALGAGTKVDDRYEIIAIEYYKKVEYEEVEYEEVECSMTALQVASNALNLEAMQLLIQHGAAVNAPASSNRGFTALQAALAEDLFGLRHDYGRSFDTQIKAVELVLQHNADVHAAPAECYGRTTLQAVCSNPQPNINFAKLILNKNAKVNAAPAKIGGVTALQGASITGSIQLVRLLLEHGADISADAAAEEGRTAVEGAAEHGREDIVRLLLNEGAQPDRETAFCRAIELAKENYHLHISDLLEEHQRNCGLHLGGIDGNEDCMVDIGWEI